jgi:hypothetical protein
LLYPMAMMVLLTLLVGIITFITRLSSYKSGEVKGMYFKLMQGQEVPEMVTKTTRCFNNMFEIPVIFYAACTLYLVLGVESLVGIVLAWVFIALRYLHATIHLTYNHILHRMLAFWLAFFCAIALWVNLVIKSA